MCLVVLNVPEKIVQQAVKEELLRDFDVHLTGGSLDLLW
jgi:hypothetical protein